MKKIISSIIAVVLLVLMTCSLLVACKPDESGSYDKITKQLKLTKSYEGKNFLADGIGKATVDVFTDGDTTRFFLEDGKTTVVIRYYMINTPESTGNVEKWGKAASLWNKQQLSQATEIVLESTTGTRPEHDSYGTRWLGYVWYRTDENSDFKCLNLETVENGFSENVSSHTDKYPYWEHFDKAEKFAKKNKLHIWSEEDDPLFNTEPVKMTLKEFWADQGAFYSFDTGVGSRVILEAYLTDLYIGDTGTYNFTAAEYDATTGETYEIKVYAQYNSNPASKMEIGHLYRFIGTVEEYPEKSGKFQIKGITYMPTGSGRTRITQENYYLTFNSEITSKAGYNITNYTTAFFEDLTVESATLNGTTLTIVGTARQITGNNSFAAEATRFTLTVTVPAGYNGEIKAGCMLRLTGLQLEEESGEVTVLKYQDITKITQA